MPYLHCPGLGLGVCVLDIGSQLALTSAWPLKAELANTDPTSWARLKAQTAEPARALEGVVNTP